VGALWAGPAWGRTAPLDPLVLASALMWVVYAATLSGRVLGRWRGRRAAYFAIAGFATLLVTLGAGVLLGGGHRS